MRISRPHLPRALLLELLATAREAVTSVGGEVLRRADGRPRRDARRKGEGDFVTSLDVRCERALRNRLLARHPDHGFLGEETAPTGLDAEFVWVVDPIDGTSNFVQGLPSFAVSAACLCRGMPVVAAVLAAPRTELFTAALGLGARLGSRRLRVAATALDDAAVLGVQWLRGVHEPELHRMLAESGARVRVLGSTVTQICDVACGRLHANLQTQGKVWDLAAPALVAAEAGAKLTDWLGRPLLPFRDLDPARDHPSLVAPQPMHRSLLARLRSS